MAVPPWLPPAPAGITRISGAQASGSGGLDIGLFMELLEVFAFAGAAAESPAACVPGFAPTEAQVCGEPPGPVAFTARLLPAHGPAARPQAVTLPQPAAVPASSEEKARPASETHAFAPVALPPSAGFGTAFRPPEQAAPDLRPEIIDICRPEAVRQPAVREIALRIPGPDGLPGKSVEVRLCERAGEIRVAVRAGAPELLQSLRLSVPELSANLDRAGFRSEIRVPAMGTSTVTICGAAAPAPGQETPGGSPKRQRREPARTRHSLPRLSGETWLPPFSL